MPRLVSVWLPAWPIERLARACRGRGRALPWQESGERAPPFALVESGVHGLRLTAVDARAWQGGARPGQALADARAALPALLTRPAEPERDQDALAALALWAGRYGPRRNVEGRDGLWVDCTGVAHLFGGEARLLDDIVARLARVGITARVGIADTAGAAFALARFAASGRTPWWCAGPGETRAALAPLPVEALQLPADGVVLLRRLGLRHIGQLHDLPREALALRFRSSIATRPARAGLRKREREAVLMAGIVLARLDRVLGLAPEPRAALAEPPLHLARRLFAEPLVSGEGVAAAVAALAHDLAGLLAARGEGGTRFALDLYRADGTAQQVRIGTSRPCRDARHLIALLAERLDTLDAGLGIDAMTLAATEAEALDARQLALSPRAGLAVDAGSTAALLDRLAGRLGAAAVTRLVAVDSHIPERAQRRRSVLDGAGATTSASSPRPRPLLARPAFLLPSPEPIAVLAEVPEGPPLRFTWRRLTRRIVRAQGPERIEPEWWRAIGRAGQSTGPPAARHLARPRDYYRIEDAGGGRYWVFRAGLYGRGEEGEAPQWFLHGVLG